MGDYSLKPKKTFSLILAREKESEDWVENGLDVNIRKSFGGEACQSGLKVVD